jgi:nicotinamide-nucleotide amidase
VGIGESSIDNAIQDHLVLPKDIVISSLFEAGRVDLTFSLPGNSPDEMERLKSLERKLAEQIGEYIYSDNGSTLEQIVVEMLIDQRITLGLAEVGSGGAISASLNDLEGTPKVLRGGLTAANNAQMALILGTPEMEMDETMVNRLCKMLGSRWGLIVTEPKVAEAGSRSVEVVIGSPTEILVKKQLPLRGRGENARSWLVSSALDLLRRELEKNRNSG